MGLRSHLSRKLVRKNNYITCTGIPARFVCVDDKQRALQTLRAIGHKLEVVDHSRHQTSASQMYPFLGSNSGSSSAPFSTQPQQQLGQASLGSVFGSSSTSAIVAANAVSSLVSMLLFYVICTGCFTVGRESCS
jgi:hypothetical protein